MGIDWWRRDPHLLGAAAQDTLPAGTDQLAELKAKVQELEARLEESDSAVAPVPDTNANAEVR